MSAAAAAPAARPGFRRPSAVPGFGPAFGIAATGIPLLVVVPLKLDNEYCEN